MNTHLNIAKVRWVWDVFGDGWMMVHVTRKTPLWRRIITRILLGSRWTRQK